MSAANVIDNGDSLAVVASVFVRITPMLAQFTT
jgi:hypothetical protein